MMHLIISILIISALIVLSVLSSKKNGKKKLFIIINIALTAVGILLLCLGYFVGSAKISEFQHDPELFSWLSDYFALYFEFTTIPFIILLALNLLSAVVSLFEKKNPKRFVKIIREAASIASSVFMLMIPFVGLLTINENVNLYLFMILSGVGQALIIRISNIVLLLKRQ